MRRKYESPSSIQMYRRCPQQYAFRYRDKLPWPPSDAMEFGSAFGKAVYDTWHECKHDAYKGGNAQIIKMLKVLYSHPDVIKMPRDKMIVGKNCELKVTLQGKTHSMFGIMDMLLSDDSINDVKTSGKPWNMDRIKSAVQHLFYTYARKKLGHKVKNFRYIVVTTQANPKVQIYNINISDESLKEFERGFVENLKSIDLDIFPPMMGGHCGWCPYRSICPAYSNAAF